MNDMNTPEMIKKVNFAKYEGKYDESVNDKLTASPEILSVETMREYLYGYTFTEGYAKGEFPDEMSMDYWSDSDNGTWEDFDYDGKYLINTVQERRILEAIDSTGDGMSRETALCVTDVGQEYEYMERVRPYNFLKVVRQSVEDGIDCLEFEPNIFGVECLYFDIHRRFDVGYPMLEAPSISPKGGVL